MIVHVKTYQSLKPSEQIKGSLIRHKRIRRRNTRHPQGTQDEDEPLAVDVGNATPKQEEAPKGKGIGRNDPLLTTFGDVETSSNGREDDDDALDVENLAKESLSVGLLS